MTPSRLIREILDAGVRTQDDELQVLGKRLFNADCLVGVLFPWVAFTVLYFFEMTGAAMFWIDFAASFILGLCLWLQWKNKPVWAMTVYTSALFGVMAFSVLCGSALPAIPILTAVFVLSMVSILPSKVSFMVIVAASLVGTGILFSVIAHVYPVHLPDWVILIKEKQLLTLILMGVFLYKIFLFIALHTANIRRLQLDKKTVQEIEGQYHTLFDNVLEGLLVLDEASGQILDANRSALSLFGYTLEQLKQKQLQDLFVEPIRPTDSLPDELQTMARKQSGEGFYVEFSHFPLQRNELQCTVLSVRNIHSRVLSDLQRVQNQIRYQRIFDTNALGIQETDMSLLARDLTLLRAKGVTDLEAYIAQNPEQLNTWLASTQIMDVNQALLHLIGAPNKEYLLQNLPEFLTDQAFDAFVKETLAIWNGARHFTGEIEIRKASGDIRVLQYTTNFPTDGNFSHLVYTYVDITDIRRQQGTIEEQVALLNEKNTILQRYIESNMQLENFAYVASHDLQTPLRAIMGFTQVLQEELAERLSETEASYFGHIVTATGNMNKLIEDLLIFSRVNSRRAVWDKVDITRVLDHLLIELQPAVEESGALIHFNDLPNSVNGDATRLRQLFQNLLTNALKFRSPEVSPLIKISCMKQKRFWHFSVKDNGIGVAPEFQDRIFLLFQKLHTPQEYKGTGIGLSLCKTIVEQHGGTLWLDSREGHGCTFHFTLAIEPELLDVSPAQSEPAEERTTLDN